MYLGFWRKHQASISWLVLAAAVVLAFWLGGRALHNEQQEALASSGGSSSSPTESETVLAASGTAPAPPDLLDGAVLPEPSPKTAITAEQDEEQELLGVWVPYLSLETEEHTKEAFEANFKKIADSAKEKGLNALFVHVRPFCDALYPSELFPWSHILTGEQGKDPGFDPLAFMVDYTHSLGLSFHAWVNPLRVRAAGSPDALSSDSPYVQMKADYPGYFMEWEGGVYLNPAWPWIRTLVADGVGEIVERYDVDGIHFDDYFYPSQDESLDWEGYELYQASVEDPMPLLEWRRMNVSAMIQQAYTAVKAADPSALFGVSPQGNIQNDENMGADVKAWCAVSGYLDYLCPQLYYSFENPALGFADALSQWTALPRASGVELWAGLALYKAGTDADDGTWEQGTIPRQIESVRAAPCSGVVLYSSAFLDADATQKEVAAAVLLFQKTDGN